MASHGGDDECPDWFNCLPSPEAHRGSFRPPAIVLLYVSVGTLRSGLRVRRERKNSFFPFSTEKLKECGTLEALGLDLCAEVATVVAFVLNTEHIHVEYSMAMFERCSRSETR
jgi:hypothetical protein